MAQTQSPATLPPGADECVTADGSARRPYVELLGAVVRAPAELPRIRKGAQRWFADRDVTFGVPADGTAPIFPFDPIPRVIGASEWRNLHRALSQRAVPLDDFLAHLHRAQRALRQGVVPGSLVYSSTGCLPAIAGVRPPRSTWCH